MQHSRTLVTLALVSAFAGAAVTPAAAQGRPADPSVRLRQVLPADIAARVLTTIADARAHGLPADALESRALKFAARGVAPRDIEASVTEQAARMTDARSALQQARAATPANDEVEAGAEALRKGVSAAGVSALARSAPSGRSLAVPLFVVGSMMDRGLSSDEALQAVRARLQARATDADLESLPVKVLAGQANRPAQTGRDLAATKRPAGAGASGAPGRAGNGPPAGVPANGGARVRPTAPAKGHRP